MTTQVSFLFLNVRLCAAAQKEPNDKAMFLKIGSREKEMEALKVKLRQCSRTFPKVEQNNPISKGATVE